MKKITVLTATRAEYGLLSNVIRRLKKEKDVTVNVVVTGMHLSPEFGLTYQEIEADGIEINKKIEILLSSDTPIAVSKSMGLAMISFAEYFDDSRPDALLVLGDRYETLAVCCAAMNARIPIIHLHGGETTEGLIDEAVRHSITKMSYLHFTTTEPYKNRVIQLGENPSRVFHVGAPGVENVLNMQLLHKQELEESIGFGLNKEYVVITYHPVTLESDGIEKQMESLFSAFDRFDDLLFVFTKANADANGRLVNQMIDSYVAKHKNAVAFESLGLVRYLSAVKYCKAVIGNSSSGIIEVPSFGVPTVNIGDRQKGRIRAESVIDADTNAEGIFQAMKTAFSDEIMVVCKHVKNPYEKKDTSEQIVKLIKSEVLFANVELKKEFYDIPYTNNEWL